MKSRHRPPRRPPLWPPIYRAEITLGCIGIPTYVLAQIVLVGGWDHGPFGPEVDHACMLLLGFAYLFLLQYVPTRADRAEPPGG